MLETSRPPTKEHVYAYASNNWWTQPRAPRCVHLTRPQTGEPCPHGLQSKSRTEEITERVADASNHPQDKREQARTSTKTKIRSKQTSNRISTWFGLYMTNPNGASLLGHWANARAVSVPGSDTTSLVRLLAHN